MDTKNSQKLFSVSITHNSRIRELSDGNRVMETELLFAKQTFCYGSHHFCVMSYGNRTLSYQKTQSKQALNNPNFSLSFYFIYFIFYFYLFFIFITLKGMMRPRKSSRKNKIKYQKNQDLWSSFDVGPS